MGTEYYKTTAPTLPSYYYQPPAHHCALHHHAIPSCCIRPFSTSVQWTSKANLATYTHTYPKTRAAQVLCTLNLPTFFRLSLLYLQYLHTYLLLFFFGSIFLPLLKLRGNE